MIIKLGEMEAHTTDVPPQQKKFKIVLHPHSLLTIPFVINNYVRVNM